ncbi:polysaccharide deacetylase family protein [Chryseolinea lacunae]|uniref:Polysaccharide deacetylase family protein n=1 Tax=Chryseolinea lacunae TaxID=2801331 RepID=A0ABS1KPH5_9BACT|nr:polysaccharide deacetylase family protein [Chryseolinea lacunae]MBL0741354.1 polysaccharide deacetylase family protein [Chryseolinea lacunae]
MLHRTPFFLPMLYPSLTWRVEGARKELYLTFDDGPVPGPTEFVLETLAAYQAKATFFCIGDNVRKHPDIFRRIAAQGHVTANHTFNHMNGWKNNATDYKQNVQRCQEEMTLQAKPAHSVASRPLFRPPYGRITRNQILALQDFNIIMWDVLSVDYAKSLARERCLRNTVKATRAGSIIVFHDSLKAEKNMTYALPRLLDHFSALDFQFKTLA